MDKSKIFLIFFFLLLVLSVAATYYRYVVLQNFTIYTNADDVEDPFDVSAYSSL